MKDETGPYWVDASLESEGMEERVWRAVDEASYVRDWAVHELNERWKASSGYPTTAELVPALTKFIKTKEYRLQRYTLLSILNSTVTLFNSRIVQERVGGKMLVELPDIKFYEPIELVFQARSVWPRYVFDNSRLSTALGFIFLEGEWESVLTKQAEDMEVEFSLFPYLWYSAGLISTAGLYKVRFNLHKPKSQMGKKLTKKRRTRERWAA